MSNSASKLAIQLQKLSNEATEKSFKYNTAEANSARTWQTEMSNTAHQREVKDLIAAGLNPVLSSGGQGAQSYTTSSASSQAENPAGAIASVYGSEMSANATRAAAAASAKATRYAAAQQAAAARYAAALQYQASVYHSDKAAEASKYKTDHSKNANAAGLLSNYVNKNTSFTLSDFKSSTRKGSDIANNKNNLYLLDPGKGVTYSNLTWRGRQYLQQQCRKYGLSVSQSNQQLAFNALVLGKSASVKAFGKLINSYNQQKINAAKRISKNKYSYYGGSW